MPASPSGSPSCTMPPGPSPPIRTRRRPARGGERRRSRSARTPSSCSTSIFRRPATEPPSSARRATGCSRRRSRSSRRATASCCRSSSTCSRPSTRRRSSASRRSTSRTSSSTRATCCATTTTSARREQLRFRSIMVDEFQDTNRLQCDVIDLMRSGPGASDVFFVGDEFQSIYGFRHADVAVFRERREAAAQRLPLTRNYRSRPEVLAAVNHLFGEEFGDDYQALAASGEFSDPVFGHPVELLVSDKQSYKGSGTSWRDGEARSIARRVRELVDTGAAALRRDRAAVRRRHRRGAVRVGAPRGGAADLPRDRPRLLRPAAGRRPALVPAPAAQPLRRRGARDRAGVAVRRRLERRDRADPPPRRQAAALHGDRALAARGARGG